VADLEERLRETVGRHSLDFEPSGDLPERITHRMRQRRRRSRLVAAGAAAAAAVVVVALVVEGPDRGRVRTVDSVSTVTTSRSEPATSSTSVPSPEKPAGPASTSTSLTEPRPPRAIDLVLTPLSRQGFGPITAGMTVREAETAAGRPLLPGGSGSCVTARFDDEVSPVLLIEPAGRDVGDGIVRAVGASVLGTDEGAQIGQSRAELLSALGQPTRTEPGPAVFRADGGELLVFESGGSAYGALVVRDMVLDLVSGDPAWMTRAVDCDLISAAG